MPIEEHLRSAASEYPDSVAIESGGTAWSYQELCARAAELSAVVSTHGCRRGDRIGLLFSHGPAMVAGMFGTLQTSTVYVPIDPQWPLDRIRFVLTDTDAKLIIVESSLPIGARQLPEITVCRWSPGLMQTQGNASTPGSPDDPAYILYTSGSTGQPKGVIQSRGNLLAHAMAYSRSVGLARSDRVSGIAPYTFDAAVMDIFGSLLAGGTLCLYDPRGEGLSHVAEWLARRRISVFHATPTLYRSVFARPRRRLSLPMLRTIVLGGELVFRRDVERCRELFSRRVVLINGYGPTECTLATQHVITGRTPLPSLHVPLGQALPHAEVLLRDQNGNWIEGEGKGEIVLRSNHVALGYWRRPELSRVVFGSDPHTGTRTYATGDQAIRLASGELIYVGRCDDQVKIRGHRVEPAEIEAELGRIAGISQAAVVVKKRNGNAVLAAWVVPQPTGGPGASDVRRQLRSSLPEYMIPAEIRAVPEVPLLASGKIDRLALAARLQAPELEPRLSSLPAVEGVLLPIWSKALGAPTMGIHDNFFELGGDSLLALDVQFESEAALGREIPSLFRYPTIAALAKIIPLPAAQPRRALALNDPQPGVPLSGPQQRYWARSQSEWDTRGFHICIAIHIRGPLNLNAMARALKSVVQRHDALRLGFSLNGKTPVQMAAQDWDTPLPVVWLGSHRERSWHEIRRIAREQVCLPFALDRPPLWRACLVRRTAKAHVLLLVFHHLIMDGWSRRIFERDLFAAYLGYVRDPKLYAPQFGSSYLRACADMRKQPRPSHGNKSSARAEEKPAWGAGSAPKAVLQLSYDFYGPKATGNLASAVTFTLGAGDFRKIQSCAKAMKLSLFSIIAAFFDVILFWWTGEGRITVTTDRANRQRSSEHVIGLFADVVVLSVQLEHDDSFEDVVRSVQKNLIAAQAGELPYFADLVEKTWPGMLSRYNEIFPAAVFLEPSEPIRTRVGELSIRTVEIGSGEITRDLLLLAKQGRDRLQMSLVYRVARFRPRTIRNLSRILRRLSLSLTASPRTPLRAHFAELESRISAARTRR